MYHFCKPCAVFQYILLKIGAWIGLDKIGQGNQPNWERSLIELSWDRWEKDRWEKDRQVKEIQETSSGVLAPLFHLSREGEPSPSYFFVGSFSFLLLSPDHGLRNTLHPPKSIDPPTHSATAIIKSSLLWMKVKKTVV